MQSISQQTKIGIFILILLGSFVVMTTDTQSASLPLILGILGLVIAIVIGAERSSKIKALAQHFFMWLIIGLIALYILGTIGSFIHFKVDFGSILIVLVIPFTIFVVRPFLIYQLGPILISLGRPDLAENVHSFMISLNPTFGFAYLQRANARLFQTHTNDALKDYNMALTIAKANSTQPKKLFSIGYDIQTIYCTKSDIFLSKRSPQQAITECDKGLAIKGQFPTIPLILLHNRGFAYLMLYKYEAALSDFEDIDLASLMAQNTPFIVTSFYALKALAYQALDRHAEAQTAWQQATALNPNYANPAWLRDTMKWPENLIDLASTITTQNTDTKV